MKVRAWVQHHFNAIHIYCRLIDLGLDKRMARWIAKKIEPMTKLMYV